MRTIGETKIYHWDEIKESFKGADIFLGNGFSININSALNYRSLFDRFLTYLSPCEQSIFKQFTSTNFEGIQNKLTDAIEVNNIFGVNNRELETTQRQLKCGLLNAIKDLHPNYSSIDPQIIFNLSQKLDWFEDIFTTNYDIFLYHIILNTSDRYKRGNGIRRYQDYFRRNKSDLRFAEQPLPGFKNIYYLHGALFLYRECGHEVKIQRGSKAVELLDLIRLKIHIGNFPVFVSEGKPKSKEETISKSKYLSFCRSTFRSSRHNLVIHGFSFSDSDDHLIDDLNTGKRKLAIGLHINGMKDGEILKKVKGIERKLFKYRLYHIRFFDSRSLF
jgi:hypothetical protein